METTRAQCREMAGVFLSIRSVSDMTNFLAEIFTSHELRDLTLRWELMRMLDQGMAQRTIADKLGVSLCKITRGARVLKKDGSVTKRIMRVKGKGGIHGHQDRTR